MNSELTACQNVHTDFMEAFLTDVTAAFSDYALHKMYDIYFGDAVPLFCANTWGINMIGLNESLQGCLPILFWNTKKLVSFIYNVVTIMMA